MKIPTETTGRVLNSAKRGHLVLVKDDRSSTGGFVILEGWEGSSGPNVNGFFDSWVESESAVEQFFAEADWEIAWQSA